MRGSRDAVDLHAEPILLLSLWCRALVHATINASAADCANVGVPCVAEGSIQGGSVDSEFMSLESQAIAYLLGRNGATKQRLANFSGCRLEIDPNKDGSTGKIEIIGTPSERKLARLCIDITLQQRNNGKVTISEKELLADGNVTTLDVDTDAVGFVLGAKGATLRQFETQFRTFMFFDNDCIPGTNQKRLYILGAKEARNRALAECENAVEYKMSGKSGGQVSSWRDRGGPRYDQGYTRRSRSRR